MAPKNRRSASKKRAIAAGSKKAAGKQQPQPMPPVSESAPVADLPKRRLFAENSSLEKKRAVRQTKSTSIFPIVGLGASAGGLEALEEFFYNMPSDGGMAFVVVVHQAAKHVSLLPELLGKCTKMSVSPIRDRMGIEPNGIYVAPPGKKVDLFDGTFNLTNLSANHVPPLPIDNFFRSLALERQERAVAIVLSGTGTDGTVGLSAVKAESGMVMVQSPDSAKFSGMPQNAIDAGLADYVLPPASMPAVLIAYARGPFLKAPPSEEGSILLIQQSLPSILISLRNQCGHDFSGYKPSTLCRRIERRMNLHLIHEPADYLKYLDQHEREAKRLFDELLIGVTSFFRDPSAFEALAENAIIPLLKTKKNASSFRVWVPGCATGEEAYSLAMLLRECLDGFQIRLDVQIFATDLNSHAIESARLGIFPEGIGTDVSAARLARFFTIEDRGYRIRKDLRDWLVFAPQNVIRDPPFTKLDLISCRNLLIYMQPELQKKLLMLFHYSLNPDGFLFLGTSETIGEFEDLFQTLDTKFKIFARKDSMRRPKREVEFPVGGTEAAREKHRILEPHPDGSQDPFRDALVRMLALDFAPPTVVTGDGGEIIHVHGRTGQFLELAPGGPPQNVMQMARQGLELELATALRSAARQAQPVIRERVAVKTNGDTVLVNLIVKQLTEPKEISGLFRISFVVIQDADQPDPQEEPSKSSKRRSTPSSRERALEKELRQSRESLQLTVGQLDASNEEMKSANEELQSTNEELQSTNEELETSKEELQSVNEELQTVNAELQEKIRALSTTNDDMNNLLNSTDIATLFLDNTLCIKRYTEQAKTIVHVIPADVGRSLRDLTLRLQYEELFADCEQVLKTLIPKEREVQTEGGHWLLMRILPYRTAEDRIDGLVMTFVDIDESKRAHEEATAFMARIVETVREPLLVVDDNLLVRFANVSFYESFQVGSAETVGQSIFALGDKQWDIPELRRMLDDIISRGASFDDFQVTHDFPRVGRKKLFVNARRIPPASAGQPAFVLLSMQAAN